MALSSRLREGEKVYVRSPLFLFFLRALHYTKPDWDIRLYTPVPRGTEEYIKTYNNRTSSERVNNRILNDYHLHDMKIHSKKRYSFFAMIAGINIHLDARIKKQKQDSAA